MTNEQKAELIAKQCRPCSEEFYSGIYQGVLLTLKYESASLEKAQKWDDLEKQISAFYFNEDGDELEEGEGGDLCDIGETAAMAFGYL